MEKSGGGWGLICERGVGVPEGGPVRSSLSKTLVRMSVCVCVFHESQRKGNMDNGKQHSSVKHVASTFNNTLSLPRPPPPPLSTRLLLTVHDPSYRRSLTRLPHWPNWSTRTQITLIATKGRTPPTPTYGCQGRRLAQQGLGSNHRKTGLGEGGGRETQ